MSRVRHKLVTKLSKHHSVRKYKRKRSAGNNPRPEKIKEKKLAPVIFSIRTACNRFYPNSDAVWCRMVPYLADETDGDVEKTVAAQVTASLHHRSEPLHLSIPSFHHCEYIASRHKSWGREKQEISKLPSKAESFAWDIKVSTFLCVRFVTSRHELSLGIITSKPR